MRLGLIVAGLIGAGVYALWRQRRPGDGKDRKFREDRPPIRVRNKKLVFDHNKTWRRDGSDRRWKPDHPEGNPMSLFEVTLVTPAKTFDPFRAREVTIEVMIDGTPTPFQLFQEDGVPAVTSPVDLEPTNGRRRLKFKVDKEVWIARVRGDGAVKWEFQSREPEVVFDAKPR